MNRVAPAQFASTYERGKYAEVLLDVAESILGVFGFQEHSLASKRTHETSSKNYSLPPGGKSDNRSILKRNDSS